MYACGVKLWFRLFFPELGSGLTDFCNADEEQVCIILQTADFDT